MYKRAIVTWNRSENKEDIGMKTIVSALHSNLAVCYAKVKDIERGCLIFSSADRGMEKLP